jgi:hypothetical protein
MLPLALTTSDNAALADAAFVGLPEYFATTACVPAASELVVHVAACALADSATAPQPAIAAPLSVN